MLESPLQLWFIIGIFVGSFLTLLAVKPSFREAIKSLFHDDEEEDEDEYKDD